MKTHAHAAARFAVISALGTSAFLGLLASPAGASFPGRNGRLAVASLDADLGGRLRTVNPDGSALRTLVSPAPDLGAVHNPAWSANGRRLVFGYEERQEDGSLVFGGLGAIGVSGGSPVKLPVPGAYRFGLDQAPAWAPGGRRVAYTRAGKPDRNGARTLIYIARTDGTGVRRLAVGSDPAWSPDGKTIAYTGRSIGASAGIWLRDARTGKVIRRLTTSGMRPDWAPDGKRLLYVTVGAQAGHVNVVNRRGGAARRLIRKRIGFGRVVWSPDGRSIAYVRRVNRPGSDEQFGYGVWTRRLRTGAERRVFSTPMIDAEAGNAYAEVSWQPLPR